MDRLYSIRLVLLLSFLLFSLSISAQKTFDIDHVEDKQMIPMEYLNMLTDPGGQLTISDILLPENQSQFKGHLLSSDLKVKNENEAYWATFKLSGSKLENGNWVLEAPDCNTSYLDLYYVLDGRVVNCMESGAMRKHDKRNFSHKNFVVELPRVKGDIQFYSRISSSLQNQFLFNVVQYKYFTSYSLSEYITLGFFYGIIFILSFYNFLLFVVNKKRINLWYAIYALSCMLVCTAEDGLGFQYLWPDFPAFNYFNIHHSPSVLLVCFLIYATDFLELNKRQPVFFKLILAFSLLSILLSFSNGSFVNATSSAIYFIPFVLIYIANIIDVWKGFKPARYFLFAFSFTIMGIFVFFYRKFGDVDWSTVGPVQIILLVYALNFALLIEVVLLSIAQALKIRMESEMHRMNISNKEIRLRNIFNSSFNALLVYDLNSRKITDANIRASKLFRHSNNQLKQMDLDNLIKLPKDFPYPKSKTMKAVVSNNANSKVNHSFEADCFDAEGNHISCEITLSSLTDDSYNSFVIAVKDISERKAAEEILKLKMAEISEKNERLESYIDSNSELENFAYVASHDMKQPIRSIKSFTQILKKHLEKNNLIDDKSEEYLNFVIGGATNLDNLVRDLLEHSKITSMSEVSFKQYSMDDIMLSVNLNLNRQIKENSVTINTHNLPTIKMESTRIIQLLQNLFSNAIKFRKEDTPCIIDLCAEEQADHWLFSLTDNGIGIQEKYQDEIFQIFRKLHDSRSFDGNGIGLATCKKIVEQHGGSIWVKSEYKVGTTFFFTIKKNLDTFNLMLVPDKEKVLN